MKQFIALMLAVGSLTAAVIDFERDDKDAYTLSDGLASVTSSGAVAGTKSLLIDTTATGGEWNSCFKTARGALAAGGEYRISFTVKILSADDDSFVHCLIRQLDVSGHEADLGVFNVKDVGKETKVSMKFKIPAGKDGYALQIHTRKKVRALVDDIVIDTVKPSTVAASFDFEQEPGVTLVEGRATVTDKGAISGARSVLIDTMSSSAEWNPCVMTPQGTFKPGTDYLISLNVKLIEAASNCYVHILMRPLDEPGPKLDIARMDVKDVGAVKRIRLKCRIQADKTTQALQIHTHNKVRALIDDIVVIEGTGERFIPVTEKPSAYTGTLSLPNGSPEFTIDLPRSKGTTASVADFGASIASEDNLQAFNNAINHCRSNGISKLIVPKGVYRFTNNSPMRFERLSDFEFDAQGSEFIWLKTRNQCIDIVTSERIMLRNFFVDWDWSKDPLGSVVSVEAIGPEGAYVDLKFIHYTDFPRKDVRIGILEGLDPTTMSVGFEGSFDIGHEFFRRADSKRASYEWLSGNRMRLNAYSDGAKSTYAKRVKPGDLFRIRHYVYDMPGITMYANTNLTLSNVTIYGVPSHAFVTSGEQHHWQFLNTHIRKRPGSTHPITCTADHHHIAQSLGYYKMDGCEFSFGGDDCLNVHDTTGFAFKTGADTLTTKNMSVAGLRPGDHLELRNDDYSPTGTVLTLKEKKGPGDKEHPNELIFESPIPEQRTSGFILFNKRYNSENIIVRNCYFHDNRARGLLLLGRNITVESNRFFHTQMGAIKIETGYTFNVWSEGYGVSNVIIRSNLFENANPYRCFPAEKHPIIYISVYLKSDPSVEKTTYPILKDILIDNNMFITTPGVITYVCSASNVTIRNNTIRNPETGKENLPHRGAVGASYASDVKVIGNTWVRSPYAPNMGVYADVETTSGIVVEGNTVVDR
ncbi:MAG: hypothetical protein HZC28_13665 [Spirochaetes bacterium]|nr:hypothetical protein [Spirochaetota bacterium]